MKERNFKKGEVIFYRSSQGTEIEVKLEEDTVWLRQNEIAKLFDKDRTVITRHINKIFSDREVDEKSNVHFLHIPNSDKPVAFYSLDVILAVGYRTNSKRAIEFRKWATNILKNYLLKGYAINKKRLVEAQEKFQELKDAIRVINEQAKHELLIGQEKEILNLLANYSKTLTLLEEYDKNKLTISSKSKEKFVLRYDGKELYPSLEEKAAHLLYLIIKDHPFVDGNKRIASFLFVYYLDRNDFLYRHTGEKKINDNALTALSLLIAISHVSDKETLIKITTNIISE